MENYKEINNFLFIGVIYSQHANKCCEFFLPKASSYAYHIQTLQTLNLSAYKLILITNKTIGKKNHRIIHIRKIMLDFLYSF